MDSARSNACSFRPSLYSTRQSTHTCWQTTPPLGEALLSFITDRTFWRISSLTTVACVGKMKDHRVKYPTTPATRRKKKPLHPAHGSNSVNQFSLWFTKHFDAFMIRYFKCVYISTHMVCIYNRIAYFVDRLGDDCSQVQEYEISSLGANPYVQRDLMHRFALFN